MKTIAKGMVLLLVILCSPIVAVLMGITEMLCTPYKLIQYAYKELEKQ